MSQQTTGIALVAYFVRPENRLNETQKERNPYDHDHDGKQSTRALQLAMKDARINEEEVEYINFHGTSTVINDKIETLAVKGALNGYAMKVPVSSTKSMVGHPQGASGALGAVVTALSLRDGVLSPTINIENPDPDCDMDYIANESRDQTVQVAISNCISFGSKNSALVLKKFDL